MKNESSVPNKLKFKLPSTWDNFSATNPTITSLLLLTHIVQSQNPKLSHHSTNSLPSEKRKLSTRLSSYPALGKTFLLQIQQAPHFCYRRTVYGAGVENSRSTAQTLSPMKKGSSVQWRTNLRTEKLYLFKNWELFFFLSKKRPTHITKKERYPIFQSPSTWDKLFCTFYTYVKYFSALGFWKLNAKISVEKNVNHAG